jgi:hypothetical protein
MRLREPKLDKLIERTGELYNKKPRDLYKGMNIIVYT